MNEEQITAQPVNELQQPTSGQNQGPLKSFKAGAIQAAVFLNNININGKVVSMPKIQVQRRYCDKNKQWKSTNSYGLNDLPKLATLIRQAYDYLITEANLTKGDGK